MIFSTPTSTYGNIYWADGFIGLVADGLIGRWAYWVPVVVMSVLSTLIFVTSQLFHAAGSLRSFPHFTVEEVEAQREGTCPRSPGLKSSTQVVFQSSDEC